MFAEETYLSRTCLEGISALRVAHLPLFTTELSSVCWPIVQFENNRSVCIWNSTNC